MVKRFSAWVALLSACLAGTAQGQWIERSPAEEARPRPAAPVPRASGDIRAQLTPRQYTTLAAEIGARVSRVPVAEGESFRQGDVLIVRMDRPQTLNAIDRDMRDALHDAFEMALFDPDIRLIKLRAEGRVFSTGAELSEFGTTRDPATPYQAGVDLARQLGGPLITYDGTQHTAVFNGDQCVDTAVVSYLVDKVSPPDGLTC